MKPEQQRIAIAEICGYNRTSSISGNGPAWTKGAEYFTRLPDYLNDLNAMHEAEENIRHDHDSWGKYLVFLSRSAPECRVFSTAAERAEAFLRTVGKWEE